MMASVTTEETYKSVIAVTGHRRLVATGGVAGLTQVIEDILKKQIQRVGGKEYLLMLNGLAVGADTLCFDIARSLGVDVAAVLPLPLSDYREDFDIDEERRAFLERIALCAMVWEPPHAYGRPKCYVSLAMSLVYYADVLIAVWDGNRNGRPGGTADVVAMAYAKSKGGSVMPPFSLPLSPSAAMEVIPVQVPLA